MGTWWCASPRGRDGRQDGVGRRAGIRDCAAVTAGGWTAGVSHRCLDSGSRGRPGARCRRRAVATRRRHRRRAVPPRLGMGADVCRFHRDVGDRRLGRAGRGRHRAAHRLPRARRWRRGHRYRGGGGHPRSAGAAEGQPRYGDIGSARAGDGGYGRGAQRGGHRHPADRLRGRGLDRNADRPGGRPRDGGCRPRRRGFGCPGRAGLRGARRRPGGPPGRLAVDLPAHRRGGGRCRWGCLRRCIRRVDRFRRHGDRGGSRGGSRHHRHGCRPWGRRTPCQW